MADKKRRLSKGIISSIITAAVVAVISIVLIIVNLYIPVKYLSTYIAFATERDEGEMKVAFIDVGYGDCIVVILPDGKTMLIDSGDNNYSHNLKIMRYLNENKIDTIDYLVCTSVKNEHCAGFEDIIKYKNVSHAYIPYCNNTSITSGFSSFMAALTKSNISYEYSSFNLGQVNEEAGYFFAFLSPSRYDNPLSEYVALNEEASSLNIGNASSVMWLQYGKTSFLFCSDAGYAVLEKLTDNYKMSVIAGTPYCQMGSYSVELDKCTVVQVAGHGSKYCTYANWYDLLSPEQAIISVGKNYAGCPSTAAITDITNSCNNILMTSDKGTIVLSVPKQ
jgi:competence protein ComEC